MKGSHLESENLSKYNLYNMNIKNYYSHLIQLELIKCTYLSHKNLLKVVFPGYIHAIFVTMFKGADQTWRTKTRKPGKGRAKVLGSKEIQVISYLNTED